MCVCVCVCVCFHTRVMQSSSYELSTLVTGKAKRKLQHYYCRAGVYRLIAEQYDTKSNVQLDGFQSQVEAPISIAPTMLYLILHP